MGRLFHRRLISGLAAVALFALTAVVTTAMTCVDGRPCELRLFQPPMMAARADAPDGHDCCPSADRGPGISAYGACIYQGGSYAAVAPSAYQPTVAAAILPAAWTPPAPRVIPFEFSAETATRPPWRGESPPGNRGPPSC